MLFFFLGQIGVLTLLIQILGPDIIHLKDNQDVTPVFLAAQQGYNINNIMSLQISKAISCVCYQAMYTTYIIYRHLRHAIKHQTLWLILLLKDRLYVQRTSY